MKRTRKLILALVVVMSLLMAMAVAIIPASAASTRVIYLDPGPWNVDGAKFVAYSWGGNDGAKFTEVSYDATSKLYMCKIDPTATKIIFLRKSAATLDWNNEWNRVGDIVLPTDTNNLCTVTGWSNTSYKWSHQDVWDSGKVTNNATCVATGTKTYTCTVSGCGKTKTETIAKLSHSYTGEYTYDAENDTHAQLCVRGCGKANPNATACQFNNSAVTSPDCVNGGYTTHSCVCGNSYTDSETPAGGHNYEGVVTTKPGCETKGETTYTCSGCNDSYTEEIAELGHAWQNATCIAPKTCSTCKATEGEALGHNIVTDQAVDPTCTETGLTAGEHCTRCDHKVAQTVVPATGHTFVDEKCACGQNQYIIVYFQNNWLWTNVSIYAFNEGGFIGEAWPGAKATFVKNDGTYDIYSAKVPYNATGIIFNGVKNDGSGDTDQTPDITSNITNCVMFYMHYDSKEGTQARIADKGIHTYVDGKCSACGHEAETFEEAITGTGTVKVPEGGATVGELTVQPGLVIDLNGHVLKATSLVTFAADAIIDSSAKWENDEFVEPTGLLIIPKFKIAIPTLGVYMPIWNTVNEVSGYQFVKMEDQQKVVDTVPGDDSFNVVFRPSIGDTEFNNKIFGNVENNGVQFIINVYNGTLVDGEFVAGEFVDGEFVADPEGTPISGMLDPATVATAYEDNAVKAVNVKFTGADFTNGNCYSVELFIRIKGLDENGTETYINAYYTVLAVVGVNGEI